MQFKTSIEGVDGSRVRLCESVVDRYVWRIESLLFNYTQIY